MRNGELFLEIMSAIPCGRYFSSRNGIASCIKSLNSAAASRPQEKMDVRAEVGLFIKIPNL